MLSTAVLSTSAGAAMLVVIILLVVTNITILAILVYVCTKLHNTTGEKQVATPADLKSCAAYGVIDHAGSSNLPAGDQDYAPVIP